MHEEELKRLWEALNPHFDLGSYDEFAANMQTTEDRKAFYDWAVSYEADLGPYEDYEYALKKKESPGEVPTDPQVLQDRYGKNFYDKVLSKLSEPLNSDDITPLWNSFAALSALDEIIAPAVEHVNQYAPQAYAPINETPVQIDEVAVIADPVAQREYLLDMELEEIPNKKERRMVKEFLRNPKGILAKQFWKNPEKHLGREGYKGLRTIMEGRKASRDHKIELDQKAEQAAQAYFDAAPIGSTEYMTYEAQQRGIAGKNEVVGEVSSLFESQFYNAHNAVTYFIDNYDETEDLVNRHNRGEKLSSEEQAQVRSMARLQEVLPTFQKYLEEYAKLSGQAVDQPYTPAMAEQDIRSLQRTNNFADMFGTETPDWMFNFAEGLLNSGTGQIIDFVLRSLDDDGSYRDLNNYLRDEDGGFVGIENSPVASAGGMLVGVYLDFQVAKGVVGGASVGLSYTGIGPAFVGFLRSIPYINRIPVLAEITNTMNAVRTTATEIAAIEGVSTEVALIRAVEATPNAAKYFNIIEKGLTIGEAGLEFAVFDAYNAFGTELSNYSKTGEFNAWAPIEAMPAGFATGAIIRTVGIGADRLLKRRPVTLSQVTRQKYLGEIDKAWQELSFKSRIGAISQEEMIFLSRKLVQQEWKAMDRALGRINVPGSDILVGVTGAAIEGTAFALTSSWLHGEELSVDSILDSIEFIMMMKYSGKAAGYLKVGGKALTSAEGRRELRNKLDAAWTTGMSQRYTEAKTIAQRQAFTQEAFNKVNNIFSDAEIVGGAAAKNALEKRQKFVDKFNEDVETVVITTEGLLENVSNGAGTEMREAFEYVSLIMSEGGEVSKENVDRALNAAEYMLRDAESLPTTEEGGSISAEHKEIVIKSIENWRSKIREYEGTYVDGRSVDARTTSIKVTTTQKNRRSIFGSFRGTRRLLDGAEAEVRDADGNVLGNARLTRDKSNGQLVVRGQSNRLKANESIRKIKFKGSQLDDNGQLVGLKYEITSGKSETPYTLEFKVEANGDYLYDVALFEAQKVRGKISRADVLFNTDESVVFENETTERSLINPPSDGIVNGKTIDGRRFKQPEELNQHHYGDRVYVVLGGHGKLDSQAKARYIFNGQKPKQVKEGMQIMEALHNQAVAEGNYVVVFRTAAELSARAKQLNPEAPDNVGAFYNEATNTIYISAEHVNEVFHEQGHDSLLKMREANPVAYNAMTAQIGETFLPKRSHSESNRDKGKEISYLHWALNRYGVMTPESVLLDEASAEFHRDVRLGKIKMNPALKNTMKQLAGTGAIEKNNRKTTSFDITDIPSLADYTARTQDAIVEGNGVEFVRETGDIIIDSLMLIEKNKESGDALRFSLVKQAEAMKNNPKFMEWFGDSKALDENGNPRVWGHMTNYDFQEFTDKFSSNGKGIFFYDVTREAAPDFDITRDSPWADWWEDQMGTIAPSRFKIDEIQSGTKTDYKLTVDGKEIGTFKDRRTANSYVYRHGQYNIVPAFIKAERILDYDNLTSEDALRLGQAIIDFVDSKAYEDIQRNEARRFDIDSIKSVYERLGRDSLLSNGSSASERAAWITKTFFDKRSERSWAGGSWAHIESYAHLLKAAGYDAYYIKEFGFKNLSVFNPENIKSVYSNEFSNNPQRYSIIGEIGAYQFPDKLENLDKAKALAANGATPQEIWSNTGWFFDKDQFWKTEIDDKRASLSADWNKNIVNPQKDLTPEELREWQTLSRAVELEHTGGFVMSPESRARYKELLSKQTIKQSLSEVLDFPMIFQMYPELRNTKFMAETYKERGLMGYYNPSLNILSLRKSLPMSEALSVMLHELQHGIQRMEGFATGGNQTSWSHIKSQYEHFRFEYAIPDGMEIPSAASAPGPGKRKSLYMNDSSLKQNKKWIESDIKKETKEHNRYMKALSKMYSWQTTFVNGIELTREQAIASEEASFKARMDKHYATIATWEAAHKAFEEAREKQWGQPYRKVMELKGKGFGGFEIYQRLLGEIEARNVQTRAKQGDASRSKVPTETMDVPYEDAVIQGVEEIKKDPLRFSYVGEKASLQDGEQRGLETAKLLDSYGIDPATILRDTGWQVGVDGSWRYEIPRGRFKGDLGELKSGDYRLGDIYDAADLFEKYPDAADIPIKINITDGGMDNAWFIPSENAIEINVKDRNIGDINRTVAHEIQHFIQYKENFATGGSYDLFINNPEVFFTPEVEARMKYLGDLNEYSRNLNYLMEAVGDWADQFDRPKYYTLDQLMTKDVLGIVDADGLADHDLLLDMWERMDEVDKEKLSAVQPSYRPFTSMELLENIQRSEHMESLRDQGNMYNLHTLYERLAGEVEARLAEIEDGTATNSKLIKDKTETWGEFKAEDQIVLRPTDLAKLKFSLSTEQKKVLKQRNNEEMLRLLPQSERVFGKNMPTLASEPKHIKAKTGQTFTEYTQTRGLNTAENLATSAGFNVEQMKDAVEIAFNAAIKGASYGDPVLEKDLRTKMESINLRLPDAEFVFRAMNEATSKERFWYEVSADKFVELFGADFSPKEITQIIKLVGATSPRTTPLENFRRAISAFSLYLQGKPIDTTILIDKPVTEALYSAEFSGNAALKITNFADTFAYNAGLTNRAPLSTNDVWVGWLFGIEGEAIAGNTDVYDAISRWFIDVTRQVNEGLAKNLGESYEPLQPWQLQALLWTRGRIETNKAEDGDDMASVFQVIENQLKDAGLEMIDGSLSRDILMNPAVPNILSPMIQTSYDAKVGLVGHEIGSARLDLMGETVNKAIELGVPEKIINKFLGNKINRIQQSYRDMIGTKATDPLIRKHDPNFKDGKSSLVTYLMSGIDTSINTASRIKTDATKYNKGKGGVAVSIPLAHFTATGGALNDVQARVFMQAIGLGLGEGKYELNKFEPIDGEGNAMGIMFEGKILEPEQIAELSTLLDIQLTSRNTAGGTFIEVVEAGGIKPELYLTIIEGLGHSDIKFVSLSHERRTEEVSRKSLNESIRILSKSSFDGKGSEGSKRNWEQRVLRIQTAVNIAKDVRAEADKQAKNELKLLDKLANDPAGRTDIAKSKMGEALEAAKQELIKRGVPASQIRYSLIDPPRLHEDNVKEFKDADKRMSWSNTVRATFDASYRKNYLDYNTAQMLKHIEDSSRPWKDALRSIGKERAYKIFRNKFGVDGMVREMYKDIYKEVFEDITPAEYNGFADGISARRISSIYTAWYQKIERNTKNIEANNWYIENIILPDIEIAKLAGDKAEVKRLNRELRDREIENKKFGEANDVMTDKVAKYKNFYTKDVDGLDVTVTDPNEKVTMTWDQAADLARKKSAYIEEVYENTLFRDFGTEQARIKGKIDLYFEKSRMLLDKLHEDGVLTDARVEGMDGIDYTRVQYMDYVLTEFLADGPVSKSSIGEAKAYVQGLNYGSYSKPYINPEFDMATMVSNANRAVFDNRAKRAMLEAFREHANLVGMDAQEFIKEPIPGESNPGYEEMSYYKDGQLESVLVRRDLYDSYKSPSRPAAMAFQFTNNLLKKLATGINPRFAIKNYLRDNLYAALFTTHFDAKDGLGRGFLPITLFNAFKESSKGMTDYIKDRQGSTDPLIQAAAEQGFFFDGLIREGIEAGRSNPYGDLKVTEGGQVEKSSKFTKAFSGIKEILSASEYGMRVAILKNTYEAGIQKYQAETGQSPKGEALENILIDAVYESRNFIDFSKGGVTSKFIDAYVPYFNAAVQGTTNAIRGASKNPLLFSYKLGQFTAAKSTLYMWNTGAFFTLLASLYEEDEELSKEYAALGEEMRFDYLTIDPMEKENNQIIMLPFRQQKDEKFFTIKLPTPPELAPVNVGVESFMQLVNGDETGTSEGNVRRLVESTRHIFMVPDATASPLIKGSLALFANYDSYRMQSIDREDIIPIANYDQTRNNKAFYLAARAMNGIGVTPDFMQSPSRLETAFYSFFPKSNTFVGMASKMVDYGIAKAIGQSPMHSRSHWNDLLGVVDARRDAAAAFDAKLIDRELNSKDYIMEREVSTIVANVTQDRAPSNIKYKDGLDELRVYAEKNNATPEEKSKMMLVYSKRMFQQMMPDAAINFAYMDSDEALAQVLWNIHEINAAKAQEIYTALNMTGFLTDRTVGEYVRIRKEKTGK